MQDLQVDNFMYFDSMKIYITFDYELFLGPRVGSVERCLIAPTKKIMEIGEHHQARFTFFIDVLYLIKMKEYVEKSEHIRRDYEKVIAQIKELSARGHSVQLHLHPQWYYSSYNVMKECWCMDDTHYDLMSCPIADVEIMIKEGTSVLQELSGKPVSSYRAGGYSFPSNMAYSRILHTYGITKDSSVFMKKKEYSRFQKYDYTNFRKFESFSFSDINNPCEKGLFEEYPIAASKLMASSIMYYRCLKFRERKLGKTYGDGLGVGNNLPKLVKVRNRLKQLFLPTIMPASLDAMKSIYINTIMEKAKKEQGNTFVIIGHPKNTSELGLSYLSAFLSTYKNNLQLIG